MLFYLDFLKLQIYLVIFVTSIMDNFTSKIVSKSVNSKTVLAENCTFINF